MFKKHEEEPKRRRKKGGIYVLFRTCLSLIMIGIMSVGVYFAYRSFSGVDPLKINPASLVSSVVHSDSTYNFLTKLLSFNPKLAANFKKAPILSDAQALPDSFIPTPKPTPNSPLKFRFAVVSDSHNDTADLTKALAEAKNNDAKFVVALGDYTNVGTVDELTTAKQVFDQSHLSYYAIPGDHDLWDSRNRKLEALTNFKQVFGLPYQAFSYENLKLILVDNSDDYLGMDQTEVNWLDSQLTQAKTGPNTNLVLVFSSTPFFHPSSDHIMGRVNVQLRGEATDAIQKFGQTGVGGALAGDTHFFSQYTEPTTNIPMVAVGAVTADRNIQKPRFVMVDVYDDGSYNITDTEIQ